MVVHQLALWSYEPSSAEAVQYAASLGPSGTYILRASAMNMTQDITARLRRGSGFELLARVRLAVHPEDTTAQRLCLSVDGETRCNSTTFPSAVMGYEYQELRASFLVPAGAPTPSSVRVIIGREVARGRVTRDLLITDVAVSCPCPPGTSETHATHEVL